MPAPRDPSTLLAAARLYYLQNRSQAEIARELGTSRSNVSRMLTEAQRQGIVTITVHDPSGRVTTLETELRNRFGLTDVRVAQRDAAASVKVEEQVGAQAAALLTELISDSMTVALSWGHALQAMVYATEVQRDYNIRLTQLVGGLSSISNEISGAELVRELATRLGAEYVSLHAPATLGSEVARDALLAEPSILEALDVARSADLAFVGIGTPSHGSSSAILSSMQLSPLEEKEFWATEPVGDLAARYFDVQGREVKGAVSERILAIDLDDLRNIPNVVGVAYGRAKTPGVLGALRGRLVDSLVCDEALARALLSESATKPDPDRRRTS
ncbi:sugar-binding transcriptional regulator [Nocardioides mesophilus]|uniref:Sugar-binding transcriptional regulator n=1 Tax=Nocardioides mesophilus TaxID=433659 RepID=A0A7G9RE43_9ACTN|nr:sugar-binding transcriptional regulator [Nocardioides mesophilus]QNN53868.1 sugar-binding transcriptional regulator [Nocardioides mesophilus]